MFVSLLIFISDIDRPPFKMILWIMFLGNFSHIEFQRNLNISELFFFCNNNY